MPAVPYLQQSDFSAYGVPNATTAQAIQAASIVNGYLHRPEGLVWVPDAAGNPAYMAALDPVITYTSPGAITAGTNVVVTVTGGTPTQDMIGDVLILDRNNASAVEACTVGAVTGQNITLSTVAYNHTSGCSLETGLTILEELTLPHDRSIARIARWPAVKLLSGYGRYSYGRRSTQAEGYVEEFNLLATVSHFGGPPLWIPFDVTVTSINNTTGEVWVPAGVLLAYYSEVRLRYIAGWQQANVPTDIKQACANIITALNANPGGSPAVQRMSAGGSSVSMFKPTVIDNDTKRLLAPYEARLFA